MNTIDVFFIFISGLPFGLFVIFIWNHFEKKLTLQKTKTEGEHILQMAKEEAESIFEKHKKDFHLLNQKKIQTFEKEQEILKDTIKNLQIHIDKKTHQFKLKRQEARQTFHNITHLIFSNATDQREP